MNQNLVGGMVLGVLGTLVALVATGYLPPIGLSEDWKCLNVSYQRRYLATKVWDLSWSRTDLEGCGFVLRNDRLLLERPATR